MGGVPDFFIELPPEAQAIIRKCMNRGLILTRTGHVYEMRIDKKYKIDKDSNVFTASIDTHEERKTSVSRGESAEPHDSGEADIEEKGETKE